MVALHLVFDDLNVLRCRLPRERLETCQIPLHTIKNPPFELEEIGIDPIQWRASSQWEVFRSSPSSARDGFALALGSIRPDSKEKAQPSSRTRQTSGRRTFQHVADLLIAEGGRTTHVKQAQPKSRLLAASIHAAAKLAHKVADLLTRDPLKQGYGKG